MNFRTTLFLLVLVVAVAITLYFTTGKGEKTQSPDKTEAHKLLDIDAGDVTRVAITNSDGTHLVLHKVASTWMIEEPVAARRESFEVDELVRAITTLQSRGKLDASKKTSGGLDHPSFVVELTSKGGKTTKLSFGDSSPVGDSLYVLVEDNATPEIVGNAIYTTLNKPASNYRDMKLVNSPSYQIQQLQIADKGKTIKLEKTGETWKMTEPVNVPAETSAVTDVLNSLTSLDAGEYLENPPSSATNTLTHPRLTVSFSTQPASTQPAATQASEAGMESLKFGGYQDITKKNMFVSLNGKEVAVVAASSETSFEKTALDFRNKDVATVDPELVKSFTVSINRPATTQPTTRPAELREFTIERQKIAPPVLGPALPAGGVVAPTTQPTSSDIIHDKISPTLDAQVNVKDTDLGSAGKAIRKIVEGGATQPAVGTTEVSGPTTRPGIATTQPSAPTKRPAIATTQPAEPSSPASVATTQPSSPTTRPAVATTQPAIATTLPSVEDVTGAKWIFTSGGLGRAEEGQVDELLGSFHPLHVEKYIEPAKETGNTYTLTIHAVPAKASESAEDYVFTFIETPTRVIGHYKDLQFEVERRLIDKLTGDFKTKKVPPPPPPSSPSGFPGGRSPFGGGQ